MKGGFQVDRGFKELLRAAKFAVVGVANTLIDMGVFALLAQVLGLNVYLSQVISYSAGMLNSYVFNRSWTFQAKDRFFSPALVRFVALNLVMLLVSTGLLWFFFDFWGMPKLIAKVLATGFTLVLSFGANRLWVFRQAE